MLSGFVVHYHNELNYDIDFKIKNGNCQSNKYFYYCLQDVDSKPEILESSSYRCRLHGIHLKKDKKRKSYHVELEICTLINNQDGWVNLRLLRIDRFKRALVEIYLQDSNSEQQNLTTYLLEKYPHIYEVYP
jgi:hypothetical protein